MFLSRLLIFILFYSLSTKALAQTKNHYSAIEFEDYLNLKTTDIKDYLKVIYKNLRIPKEYREQEKDISVLVTITYHGKEKGTNYSLISDKIISETLDSQIMHVLDLTSNLILPLEDKYVTHFNIHYDMEPFQDREKFQRFSDVVILSFKRISCGSGPKSTYLKLLKSKLRIPLIEK